MLDKYSQGVIFSTSFVYVDVRARRLIKRSHGALAEEVRRLKRLMEEGGLGEEDFQPGWVDACASTVIRHTRCTRKERIYMFQKVAQSVYSVCFRYPVHGKRSKVKPSITIT
jgi:hypothetical protein